MLQQQPLDRSQALPPSARRWGVVILLLSLAAALWWSHYKLFWGDELLEFYTDSKPSLGAVLYGQLHFPFSLEPPAFHLLLHLLLRAIPSPELALRLVSIVSLLVTELCVARVTWRLTRNPITALIAMALPFFLVTLDYAPEGRVYGPFAALFAIALMSYQSALIADRPRRRSLIALGASLSLAILVHYYGIFLPLPFLFAEALKSLRRRRIDWPMLLATAGPLLVFALNLPFQKPLAEIQQHYYTGETHWPFLAFTYEWIFGHFGVYYLLRYAPVVRTLSIAAPYIGVPALALVFLSRLQLAWREPNQPEESSLPMQAALAAACALPFINLTVARFVTHAYSMRYSLPCAVALAVVLAWILAPSRRFPRTAYACLIVLLGLSILYAGRHIVIARQQRALRLSEAQLPPNVTAALASIPDHHVYMQDLARFITTDFYAGPDLRDQLVAIYSLDRELYWWNRDPSSIYARNMQATTALPILRFESLVQQPGPHIFVIYHDKEEEWIDKELAVDGASVEPLGAALGGTAYRVTFVPGR